MRERLVQGGVVLALAVAAGVLYFAFATGRDEPEPIRRGAILRVFPEADAVALRQDAIGVELAFGYRATITIDGRGIPDDQLDVVPGINRVSFTPGSGKEIEQLDEGRHCATVAYVFSVTSTTAAETESTETTETTSGAPGRPQSYTWCFIAA